MLTFLSYFFFKVDIVASQRPIKNINTLIVAAYFYLQFPTLSLESLFQYMTQCSISHQIPTFRLEGIILGSLIFAYFFRILCIYDLYIYIYIYIYIYRYIYNPCGHIHIYIRIVLFSVFDKFENNSILQQTNESP